MENRTAAYRVRPESTFGLTANGGQPIDVPHKYMSEEGMNQVDRKSGIVLVTDRNASSVVRKLKEQGRLVVVRPSVGSGKDDKEEG